MGSLVGISDPLLMAVGVLMCPAQAPSQCLQLCSAARGGKAGREAGVHLGLRPSCTLRMRTNVCQHLSGHPCIVCSGCICLQTGLTDSSPKGLAGEPGGWGRWGFRQHLDGVRAWGPWFRAFGVLSSALITHRIQKQSGVKGMSGRSKHSTCGSSVSQPASPYPR